MSRLLIINPVTGISTEGLVQRQSAVTRYLGPDWDVEFATLPDGPKSIESREEKALGAAEVVRYVRRCQGDASRIPADVMMVWCASDPGVRETRELTRIPVIGPGEASIHLATLLGGRFTYLTPLASGVQRTREFVETLDFGSKLTSVHPLGCPVLELRQDLEQTVARIVNLGRQAVEKDGASSLILGCMGFFGVAERCSKELGIPVIDPAVAGSLFASMLVHGGLSFSSVTYTSPAKL